MSNRRYFAYFLATAIAFSLQPQVLTETKPDLPLNPSFNFREKLASEWADATLTHTLEPTTKTTNLKFSPDGKLLASVGTSQITLWQVEGSDILRILPGHYATESNREIAPTAIAFSPDSNFLATATWSQGLFTAAKSIVVRNSLTGEEVLSLAERDGCRQVLFAPSGNSLYGTCGGGVTAWSFPQGEKLFSFDSKYPVEAIAISPDGEVMATVDANITGGQQGEESHNIQLWQLNQNKPTLINTLDGHANDIAQLEFTSDGNKLVSSSYDGKVNVWNWQQGTTERRTNNLYSDSGLFSLSANSRLIAGNFHSSLMTNLITGLPLRNVLTIPQQKKTHPSSIAFSPQGNTFAWAGKPDQLESPVIYLWQTEADNLQSQASPTNKDNYRSLAISQYWGNQEQLGGEAEIKLNTSNPSPTGKDPQVIALAGLGLTDVKSEQVELEYPQENLATVTITQTNLRDDSVADIRYLVKFAPYGAQSEQQWQVVWAGKQFRCQANRGHQDWGADLCQ